MKEKADTKTLKSLLKANYKYFKWAYKHFSSYCG